MSWPVKLSNVGAATVGLLLPSLPTLGAVVAQESFSYSAGAGLTGLNGGTGWAGAWGQGVGGANLLHGSITAAGLSHPAVTESTGGALASFADRSPGGLTTRDFESSLPPMSDVWLSFLYQPARALSGTGYESWRVFISGSTPGLYPTHMGFGARSSPTTGEYTLLVDRTARGAIGTGVFTRPGVTDLLVVRAQPLGDNIQASLWINPPTTDLGPPVASGLLRGYSAPFISFAQLGVFAAPGNEPLHAAGTFLGAVDEIRVATDYAGVIQPIPGHATHALIPVVLLAFRRRRS